MCDGRQSGEAAKGVPEQGWVLVGLIVILSSVFTAMSGVSLTLAESRRVLSLRENEIEAISLAQAGVMQALYDFRQGTGVRLGLQPDYTVDAGSLSGQSDDDVFILGNEQANGPMADFLLVNMKPGSFATTGGGSSVCGSRNRFQSWVVRNVLANGGSSLVIDRMAISWSPNLGEGVLSIRLQNNNTVWTTPSCTTPPGSGTSINITDRAISPGQRWTDNRIYFTLDMSSKEWIRVDFTMSDASTRSSRYEPGISNRSADFTIRSIGEVRKGAFPFVLWRRLQAEYRACATISATNQCDSDAEERTGIGRLLSYRELATKSP